MKLSRADIPTDHFQQLPGAFLKLQLQEYIDLINEGGQGWDGRLVEPLPSQIALVNGINNPKYRFGVAALSRRQGKTFISNVIGQLVALVPNCHILIMAPNYNLATISFELQRKLIARFNVEVKKDNAKDRVIELCNGSTIRIGSVGQVDSCVGRSYDLIIFDEAALTEDGKDAFNVSLRPTLDKPTAKALFISTPRGKSNWFSEFFDRGFSSEYPLWFSIQATWKDNPRMTEQDVLDAKKSMSDAEFRQEYEADFSIFEGKIWNLPEEAVRECDMDLEQLDIVAGLDLGYKDPTALVVLGYHHGTDTFYALSEYFAAEKTTSQHAIEFHKLVEEFNIDIIFIDSANQQQKRDFLTEHDLPTVNAKKSVLDGIAYVANYIDSGRFIVDPSLEQVLFALDQYQWDNREGLTKEKPKHNMASHMADAIRYGIYTYSKSDGSF